jgi:hypothetical protein
LFKGLPAGLEVDELEFQAERSRKCFEDTTAGGDDFFADAIAGNQA